MSMATTSAMSLIESGRAENVNHRKMRIAYSESASLIAERMRSYVWSSVGGSVARVLRSVARLRHFAKLSTWHAAHRNLLDALKLDSIKPERKTYMPLAPSFSTASISCLTSSFLHF